MFTRLAPSHGAGSGIWGALVVGIPGPAVESATGVPMELVTVAGVPWAAQLEGAIPGRAVNLQQVTKLLMNTNNPMDIKTPNPIQMNWLVVGRFKDRALFRKFSFVSGISLHGGRNWQVFFSHSDPLISFFNEHDRDVFHNRVLSGAVLADQPCIPVKRQVSIFFAHAVWAAQDIQQIFVDHGFLLLWSPGKRLFYHARGLKAVALVS
jgi:hypothetical protein